MKKIIFTLASLMIAAVSTAQEDQTDSQNRLDSFTDVKKHELSLDVTAALAIPALNPRYEYILGRYSGIGVEAFISLGDNDNDGFEEMEKYSITPYYRQYFFSKEDYGAKGFYGEGFVKFLTYEPYGFFQDQRNNETYFETAIGAGIGWKWVSNSGFLIDLGIGVGRDLGIADDPIDDFDVRLRGGLNFGWRF